eukprot:6025100-Pyramimonas_sp.AAC.1
MRKHMRIGYPRPPSLSRPASRQCLFAGVDQPECTSHPRRAETREARTNISDLETSRRRSDWPLGR